MPGHKAPIGDKTFREITDEFAELIIPKIWLREDRKIARVAKKLSISPKKVRRVLMRAGVLGSPGVTQQSRSTRIPSC